MILHGNLQKIHSFQAVGETGGGQQHDHGGTGADDQGVDENAQRLQQSAFDRMADVGGGSGTGGGTGTGLVGKQSPFCAVHDDGAQAPGHSLAKPESFQENALEDRRKLACVFYDDKDGDQKIADSHHRHHDIQHLDGGVFAQYDDGGESHQGDGGVKGRDVESIFKGGGNGVSDDLADAAPADQAG